MGNNMSYESQKSDVSDLPLVHVTKFGEYSNDRDYSVYAILGLSYGDESKGKVVRYYLLERESKARYCIRFNGGPNAGHTVYVRPGDTELFITPEKRATYNSRLIKFATHQVPTGVLFGIPSIIGYNCVVDLEKLHKEITEIADHLGRTYQEIANLITITPEAHIITPWQIQKDRENNAVGTTGSGIGPCYSEKALRTGYRIIDYYNDPYNAKFTEMTTRIAAMNETSFISHMIIGVKIQSCKNIAKTLQKGDVVVMEGAQGFHLDINHGMYPHVTSSDCTISSVCSYGFLLNNICSIGVTKGYPTYVGSKQLEVGFVQDEKHTGQGELIRQIGKEYGVTTGRRRQCLPLNLDMDMEALLINQTSEWIISKSDVLVVYDRVLKKLAEYCTTHTFIPEPDSEEDRILFDFIKNIGQDKYEYFQKIVDNGAFRVIHKDTECKLGSWEETKQFIIDVVKADQLHSLKKIIWWDNPESEVQMME